MAKLALINRQLKREATVKKFAAKRQALEAIINDQSLSEEDRYQARLKLQDARIQRISTQLELNNSTTRTVANNE